MLLSVFIPKRWEAPPGARLGARTVHVPLGKLNRKEEIENRNSKIENELSKELLNKSKKSTEKIENRKSKVENRMKF